MTFKSLLDFGKFSESRTPAVDHYHSGSGDYGHYDHGHGHGGWKGKGGGGGSSGAALSALTLLAFLFFINVMQQSLDASTNTTTTTLFLREGEQAVRATRRDDAVPTKIVPDHPTFDSKYVPIKTSSPDGSDNRD